MASPDLGFSVMERVTLVIFAALVISGLSALGGLIVWWFA